jgi:selenide,water dikinase
VASPPAFRLTELASCGGCAAKLDARALRELLAYVPASVAPPGAWRLLVGTETADDAAVYALDDERALVLTTDFVPPLCDDPHLYGQLAAANALSDVFAMGGRPLVALAICAFPKELPAPIAAAICAGGAAKAAEAGAIVAGGHTVRSPELFYGLAVTGEVHPARVVRNRGAQPGDLLVLTKPLGAGALVGGYRAGAVAEDVLLATCRRMAALNDRASRLMVRYGAHAATDVTGFGLVGHAVGMARASSVRLRVFCDRLPAYDGALALVEGAAETGGLGRNRRAFADDVRIDEGLGARALLAFDPQTSGGLLAALAPEAARAFITTLRAEGVDAEVIGQAEPAAAGEVPLWLTRAP